jgi:thiamine biosynthesis protein ThiI
VFERVCLVHYHEIGLKGKNRKSFENQLVRNLWRALEGLGVTSIGRISGYVLVRFSAEKCDELAALVAAAGAPAGGGACGVAGAEAGAEATSLDPAALVQDAIAARAARVPGVARVSEAYVGERDLAQMEQLVVVAMRDAVAFLGLAEPSFKVHARKSNTTFDMHTIELNRAMGAVLCEAFPQAKVQMKDPDIQVNVLVVEGETFVYAKTRRGVGGLPVGTAGRCVALFSSGFDSPVATWMVGRRGATMVAVHFSGRPQTSDGSEWLCQDLCRALNASGVVGRLYVVPLGDAQREIALTVPQKLRVIMYRRLMYRMAERLCGLEGAKALVTGESLGQVASQTLDNIRATSEVVTSVPIFRPLIGSDKQEIIARAQELGTYEISAETAPDCCTLFMPRRPETHAKESEVLEAWALLDVERMEEALLAQVEWIDFDACASYTPPAAFPARHKELGPA